MASNSKEAKQIQAALSIHGELVPGTTPPIQWSQNPWMFKSLIYNGEAQLASSICGVCICGFWILEFHQLRTKKCRTGKCKAMGLAVGWLCRCRTWHGGLLDLQEPTSWTQRNWSHGDLKNWGVQVLSKGMDAIGFQQIVAMWNANPVSLGLLTSQEMLQIQILYEI